MSGPSFTFQLTALPEHIDELGHVNNAVWVQWIQQVATAHWFSVALPEYRDAYVWLVVRHEIDYLRPALEGQTVTARTWVDEAPRGARFDRFMEFTGPDGKLCVRARTGWAMLDKTTGRPQRIRPEIVAPFFADFLLSYSLWGCHTRPMRRTCPITKTRSMARAFVPGCWSALEHTSATIGTIRA